MERTEVAKILTVIAATYPTFKPQDKKATVDAWEFMLKDYNYNDIQMALKTYIATTNSAFAPSISQLIGMVHKPHELNVLPETQAWAIVSKAIRRANYYAEEEWENFPEEIKACTSPSMLRTMASDSNFNESVESSNFMRSYRAVLNRKKFEDRVPLDIRMAIETRDVMRIEGE